MEVFDQYAKNYDLWYEKPFGSSAFRLEVSCIERVLDPFSSSLEVGIGNGRFAKALGVLYGLDPSIELLRLVKRRGIVGILGRAEALLPRPRALEKSRNQRRFLERGRIFLHKS